MSINDIKRLNDKTLLTPISTAPTPFLALCYRVWRLRRRGQAQGRGSLLPWTSTLASSNVAWSLLPPLLFLLFIPLFHSHPKVWAGQRGWKAGLVSVMKGFVCSSLFILFAAILNYKALQHLTYCVLIVDLFYPFSPQYLIIVCMTFPYLGLRLKPHHVAVFRIRR